MNHTYRGALVTAFAFCALAGPVRAAEIDCNMRFEMSSWSIFYKRSNGSGTITCDNGQSMRVTLEAHGGGISFGKSRIKDGVGAFSGVHDISDLLGGYASAEAHAGAKRSAKAQVVTKGSVSLALSGKGSGWNLGVAFGSLVIERR